ncbi:hypothetical protein MHYP_G00284310 [Metynnis hypsauchen]
MEKRYVLLVTLVCTSLALTLLVVQWRHIRSVTVELMDLERRVRALQKGQEWWNEGVCCPSGTCCGVVSAERRSFLHLIPASAHSNDERDLTVLTWALGQSQGVGLQASGETITVATEGNYFIYSQVLYKDTTWVMGHVITKRLNGAETKLMKCLKSMPSNDSVNTCYTAGVHFLESGSVLELSVPRKSAELILIAHATFLGIFSI